ncbi:MAG: ABC transporter permease [Defluviitaleaceae bacterium]|nr:ABC transporter permease [Defluviitaleaceae bacterium]
MGSVVSLVLKILAAKWRRTAALMLFTLMLGVAAGFAGEAVSARQGLGRIPVALVDLDDSFETRLILAALADALAYGVVVDITATDERGAREALESGSVTAVITLPLGFGAGMVSGQNIPFGVEYNSNRPLASALVRIAADAFADMLRSAQTGVYVTLGYAAALDLSPQEYNMVFVGVNMRFIGLVQNRADMFERVMLYAALGLGMWQTYFIAAYVALSLCASFVTTDAVRRGLNAFFLRSMALRGVPAGSVVAACAAAYFVLFVLLHGGLWLCLILLSAVAGVAAPPLGIGLVWAVLVVCAVLAAFAAMLTFAFRSEAAAGVFATGFAAVSLLLSGGVVPVEFFAEGLGAASDFVFSTWAVRLIAAAVTGGGMVVPALASLAFAVVFLAVGTAAARSETVRPS